MVVRGKMEAHTTLITTSTTTLRLLVHSCPPAHFTPIKLATPPPCTSSPFPLCSWAAGSRPSKRPPSTKPPPERPTATPLSLSFPSHPSRRPELPERPNLDRFRSWAAEGDSPANAPDGEGIDAVATAATAIGEESEQPRESAEASPEGEDLGKAIRQLQQERLAGVKGTSVTSEFWQGVLDETRLIDWPSFQKVLGTTGVVMGVIIGSSLVLLTVNAVLAELADNIFNNPGLEKIAKDYLKGII